MDTSEESAFDIIPLPSEGIAESTRRVRLTANSSFNDFLSMRKYKSSRGDEVAATLQELSRADVCNRDLWERYGKR